MRAAEGMEEEAMNHGVTCSSSSVPVAAVTVLKRRCDGQSTEASAKFKKAKFAGQVKGYRRDNKGYKLKKGRDECNYSTNGVQPVRNLELYNGPFQKCNSTQQNNEANDDRSVEEPNGKMELSVRAEYFDAQNPSPSSFSLTKSQRIPHSKVPDQSTLESHEYNTDDFPICSSNEEQNVSHLNETFQNHDNDVNHRISYCESSNVDVVENCSFSQSSTSSSDSSSPSFGFHRQSFQPVRGQGSFSGSGSNLRTLAQEMPQLRTPNFHNIAGHAEIDLLELWQNQLTAKAIVDNAINKTLEEMGLSPDPEANMLVAERTAVEDQGISAAIRSQGLVTPRSTNQAPFSSEVWSRISEFSETVLTYNRLLSRSQNFGDNMQPSLDSEDHINRPVDGLTLTVESDTSTQNTDFIDQAVAMAISSQGLTVRRASL